MTTSRSEPSIRIAAAVVRDEAGRVLLVRKRGTAVFMLPGGKIAPGESGAEALAREIEEELGCALAGLPEPFGRFSAPAANEPGRRVEGEIFARLAGAPRAAAEIEELRWHRPDAAARFVIAPLARDHVLPRLPSLAGH